jgi:hypothetical protein
MLPQNLGWTLIIIGLAAAAVGALFVWGPGLPAWFGRLPGDLHWEGKGYRVSVPIVTCLIISIALSVIMWLVRHLRGP